MNIFFLHRSAPMAAALHADIHVGKMLLESVQLLSTAHHLTGGTAPYKPTHANHPCALWVRESKLHYGFVWELAQQLGREFFKRRGKRHKTAELLAEVQSPPVSLPATWREPPLAMPEEFRGPNAVNAYRAYYLSKAATMPLRWSGSDVVPPLFYVEDLK